MVSDMISVIIPTYNRAAVLIQTLASLKAQTYTNWECIIVDDGSTDETSAVVSDYIKDDARFEFHTRPSSLLKGANSCRNYGFGISRGEYINWFDSDDIMLPDYLNIRLEVLQNDKELAFCACIAHTFKTETPLETNVLRPAFFKIDNYAEDFLLNGFFMYTPAPLWRREFLQGKALFDPRLHRSQEADFHLRMLSFEPKYEYLQQVLFAIRIGNESISSGAAKSMKAQTSIFLYYSKAFDLVCAQKVKNFRVLRYIFYRQMVTYFNICQLAPGIAGRLGLLKTYFPYIVKLCRESRISFVQKIRVFLGLISTALFKIGYSLLYFPAYDARSYNDRLGDPTLKK